MPSFQIHLLLDLGWTDWMRIQLPFLTVSYIVCWHHNRIGLYYNQIKTYLWKTNTAQCPNIIKRRTKVGAGTQWLKRQHEFEDQVTKLRLHSCLLLMNGWWEEWWMITPNQPRWKLLIPIGVYAYFRMCTCVCVTHIEELKGRVQTLVFVLNGKKTKKKTLWSLALPWVNSAGVTIYKF